MSVVSLCVRFDLPEELVHTARDLGEEVRGVGIAEVGRRIDSRLHGGAESRKGARERQHVLDRMRFRKHAGNLDRTWEGIYWTIVLSILWYQPARRTAFDDRGRCEAASGIVSSLSTSEGILAAEDRAADGLPIDEDLRVCLLRHARPTNGILLSTYVVWHAAKGLSVHGGRVPQV